MVTANVFSMLCLVREIKMCIEVQKLCFLKYWFLNESVTTVLQLFNGFIIMDNFNPC